MTVKFFGLPRHLAGRENMVSNATNVRELLQELSPVMCGKVRELAEGTSQLDGSLTILRNGRNIVFLDKLDTELKDEDEVTFMAQIVGG